MPIHFYKMIKIVFFVLEKVNYDLVSGNCPAEKHLYQEIRYFHLIKYLFIKLNIKRNSEMLFNSEISVRWMTSM